MAVYLVIYDLVNKPTEFDYEPLWAELKRLKCYRTQLSAWLANLSNTPEEVRQHFMRYMHKDDRLMVSRIRPREYDYINAMAGTNDWLKSNPLA
jgi:hypothetical protein